MHDREPSLAYLGMTRHVNIESEHVISLEQTIPPATTEGCREVRDSVGEFLEVAEWPGVLALMAFTHGPQKRHP